MRFTNSSLSQSLIVVFKSAGEWSGSGKSTPWQHTSKALFNFKQAHSAVGSALEAKPNWLKMVGGMGYPV